MVPAEEEEECSALLGASEARIRAANKAARASSLTATTNALLVLGEILPLSCFAPVEVSTSAGAAEVPTRPTMDIAPLPLLLGHSILWIE